MSARDAFAIAVVILVLLFIAGLIVISVNLMGLVS
jgi:hypothetical protein